jgi:hypothetical protein
MSPTYLVDDNLAMSECQSINCVKRFVCCYGGGVCAEYLRAVNAQDMARLLAINTTRGFGDAWIMQ